MDLVDFDGAVFADIRGAFAEHLEREASAERRTMEREASAERRSAKASAERAVTLQAIPISALHGDNVTACSERTPWYDGPPLLEYLETVQVDRDATSGAFRMPVQLVLRPDHDFRGYAGQIVSGTIRAGDAITVWPSARSTTVRRIVSWDGDLEQAFAPMSVALVLGDALDVSRGDVMASGAIDVATRFSAQVVWMDERPLDPSRVYLLKHGTRTVTAECDRRLALNQIGAVTVSTARPLAFDPYLANRATGGFILIDPATQFTAGAGMITAAAPQRPMVRPHHSAAARLAIAARAASTDGDAIEAVRHVLEEVLT
jgi:bifunctional enzyme CysN/CysC